MPEQRKPVENPVLVDAMATFKLDLQNREHELAFLKAAVEARYLLPAQVQPDPDAEPDENGQIFLNDFDMNPHAMIFRAWDNYDNLSSKLLTFYLVETEVPGESSVSVGDGDAPDASELTAQIIMPTDGSTVSCPKALSR